MSIAGFRKSRFFGPMIVSFTLLSYMSTLWAPRVAKAAPSDAVGIVDNTGGGAPSLARPLPGGNDTEGLATVDLATGTAKGSYPLQMPKARGEAQPSLGLVYNQSSGPGFAGMGWTLDLPSIVRRGHAGIPRFQDQAAIEPQCPVPSPIPCKIMNDLGTDDYYVNGQLLIPVSFSPPLPSNLPAAPAASYSGISPFAWALYRAEVDDGSRYFFDGLTWVKETKAGNLIQFGVPLDRGLTAGLELADSDTAPAAGQSINGFATNPIYRWNMVRDTDATGNTVYYVYDNQHALFPSSTGPTTGLQFLTDIYDTSVYAPNVNLTASFPGTTAFAHHVHLTWTVVLLTSNSQTPPYVFSPIWKALPYGLLSTVDVTSATFGAIDGSKRQLVRRYQLSYTTNDTLTRAYLNSITPLGDCLSFGGPYVESGGVIPVNLGQCAAGEKPPVTTYTYYGINPTVLALPGFQLPSILSKNIINGPTGPVITLADLDGDSVSEMVTGNEGFGVSGVTNNSGYYPPGAGPGPMPVCNFGCTTNADLANEMVVVKTVELGLDVITQNYSGFLEHTVQLIFDHSPPPQCSGCSISGPTVSGVPMQPFGLGGSIPYWSSWRGSYIYGMAPGVTRNLFEAFVDDAMWGYSILGDWTSTGVVNLLDVMFLPPDRSRLDFHPGPAGYDAVSVAQFAGLDYTGNSNRTLMLAPLALPQSDIDHLHLLNGTARDGTPSGTPSPLGLVGGIRPANAVDVDGDGLPDISLVGTVANDASGNPTGYYNPYYSTRERQGTTHPFAVSGPRLCAPTAYDPTTWLPPPPPPVDAGVCPPKTNCPPPVVRNSTSSRAFADIDGDGLADLVVFNKSDANLSTSAGAYTYLNFNVLPSRGDGRFGVPAFGANCGAVLSPYGGGFPSKTSAGTSQSDSLGTTGYDRQSSVTRFGDLNGDGLSDYAVLDPSGLNICLRYGGGWDNAQYHCVKDTTLTGTDQANGTRAQANILIGDLDGSGVNQVLYVPPTSGGTADVLWNSVTGEHVTVPAAPGAPVGNPRAVRVGTPSRSIVLGVVMREGLLASVSNGVGATTTFDRYATVSNMNIGKLPVPAWVVMQTTTSNNAVATGQNVTLTTNYTYGTPIYDPRDREFLGFKSITEMKSGSATSPGTFVKTTFATDTCASNSTCTNNNPDYAIYHAIRGLPVLVETSLNNGGNAGTKYASMVTKYTFQTPYVGLDGRRGISVEEVDHFNYLWDDIAQGGTNTSFQAAILLGTNVSPPPGTTIPAFLPPAVIVRRSYFDSNGNLASTRDEGQLGNDQVIQTAYTWNLPGPDQSPNWNWRKTQELTAYGTGVLSSATPGVREYDFVYDNIGRLVYEWTPFSGAATLPGSNGGTRVAPPPQNGSVLFAPVLRIAQYAYDSYGNVQQVGSDANLCKETIAYDTKFHQLPITVTQYPNGCQSGGTGQIPNPAGQLITSYSFDRGLGQMLSETSPALELTLISYDDFGRVSSILAPDPSSPMGQVPALTAKYDDTGPIRHIHVETADGTATGSPPRPSTWVKHDTYVDAFGETMAQIDQVGTPANPVSILSGVHTRDPNGRTTSTSRPTVWTGADPNAGGVKSGTLPALSSAAAVSTYAYDGLGRVVRSTDFNGNVSTSVYYTAQLAVDVYDQEQALTAGPSAPHAGAHKTITKDGHGRLKAVDLRMVSPPSDIVTTYDSYLATGELTAVTTGGVQRTMFYDSLGRMVQNNEPNAGTWTYAHDFDGRLVGTSDARGCGENIFYDGIGRIVAKDYIPCLPSARQPYVTQAPYTVPNLSTGDGTEAFYIYGSDGRLKEQKDLAKDDVYGYDARGRVISIQRSIVAPPSALGPYGAPVVPYFPSSAAIASRYASNVFTKIITYDLTDRALTETTGATAVTAMGNTETRSYSYDGRLQSDALTGGSAPVSFLKSNTLALASNGAVTTTLIYGDAAATTSKSAYGVDGMLSSYHLYRSANGPWATVSPAASNGDPTNLTQQADLLNLTLLRDGVGNPTSIADKSTSTWPAGAAAVSQTFVYDDAYRLTKATSNANKDKFVSPTLAEERPGYAYPNGFLSFQSHSIPTRFQWETFSYDARGNMTSSTDDLSDFFDRSLGTQHNATGYYCLGPDQLETASENPPDPTSANHLLNATDLAGNVEMIDVSSATAAGGGFDYLYDEAGRLSWAQQVQPEWFAYDADGHRMISVHQLEPGYTVYVFDSLVLHDASFSNGAYEDDTATEQVYVDGGLGRVFYDVANVLPKVKNNQTHAFLSLDDGRGSVGVVIDHDSSEVVERIAYQPYGNLDADYRPARWNYNYERRKFGGHWDNQDDGLVYMGARYYSPRLGRFMSPDPLTIHGLAGDPNPYAYANGNPIMYTDPTGLAGWVVGKDAIRFNDDPITGHLAKSAGAGAATASTGEAPAAGDSASGVGSAAGGAGAAIVDFALDTYIADKMPVGIPPPSMTPAINAGRGQGQPGVGMGGSPAPPRIMAIADGVSRVTEGVSRVTEGAVKVLDDVKRYLTRPDYYSATASLGWGSGLTINFTLTRGGDLSFNFGPNYGKSPPFSMSLTEGNIVGPPLNPADPNTVNVGGGFGLGAAINSGPDGVALENGAFTPQAGVSATHTMWHRNIGVNW